MAVLLVEETGVGGFAMQIFRTVHRPFDFPASIADNIPGLCDSVNPSFLPRFPLFFSVPNDFCTVVQYSIEIQS